MSEAYMSILNQQQKWAKERGIGIDKNGYTYKLNNSLFRPLSPETEKEFRSGRGDELGGGSVRGKMQALHSSSALVVNVFDYWRTRNVDVIAQACGASKGAISLRFERTYPTRLGGIPPHLDVEFSNPQDKPLVVESKFTEPYHRKTKRYIKSKYLDSSLWAGLGNCESLVRLIHEEEKGKTSFWFLDAPQLLKHILGLSTAFKGQGFELLYLWYDFPSPEAEKHREEIREFEKHIGSEVNFRHLTYQELFKRLRNSPDAEVSYIDYLTARYFNMTKSF